MALIVLLAAAAGQTALPAIQEPVVRLAWVSPLNFGSVAGGTRCPGAGVGAGRHPIAAPAPDHGRVSSMARGQLTRAPPPPPVTQPTTAAEQHTCLCVLRARLYLHGYGFPTESSSGTVEVTVGPYPCIVIPHLTTPYVVGAGGGGVNGSAAG